MDYLVRSARLGFRQWQDIDKEHLYRLNSDPVTMEFFPKTKNQEESEQDFERYQSHIEEHGFGFFAVDRLEDHSFVGIIGLANVSFELDFGRFVEIGWRTFPHTWGRGLASEGAKCILEFGFNECNLSRIYSLTTVNNKRSEHVMKKIGMKHDRLFDHPLLSDESPLLRHTLYSIHK